MLHASLKIYAALPGWSHGGHSLWRLSSQRPGAENGVHIRLELDLQVILVHLDLPDDELQIIALQGVLTENVPKDLHGGACRPVHLDDGIALVREHVDLVADALDLLLQVGLQLVIGLRQQLLLLRVLHEIPDTLALGDLQLLLEIGEYLRQPVGALLRLLHILPLPGQILVEPRQHIRRALHHLPDISFQQLVQLVSADVVGGTARPSPAMVGTAGVGAFQIAAAHGEHGAAAVPAYQKAGVHIVVLLYPPVVGGGALLP